METISVGLGIAPTVHEVLYRLESQVVKAIMNDDATDLNKMKRLVFDLYQEIKTLNRAVVDSSIKLV